MVRSETATLLNQITHRLNLILVLSLCCLEPLGLIHIVTVFRRDDMTRVMWVCQLLSSPFRVRFPFGPLIVVRCPHNQSWRETERLHPPWRRRFSFTALLPLNFPSSFNFPLFVSCRPWLSSICLKRHSHFCPFTLTRIFNRVKQVSCVWLSWPEQSRKKVVWRNATYTFSISLSLREKHSLWRGLAPLQEYCRF